MRFLKVFAALALAAMVAAVWSNRSTVVAAYVEEREPVALAFDGLEFDIEVEDLGPSPYALNARSPVLSRADAGLEPIPSDTEAADVEVLGGSSIIHGVVRDNAGAAVPGAVVSIERVSSDGRAFINRLADDAGAWAAEGVRGGRYVVRAWQPGQATMLQPLLFFLEAEKRVELTLVLSSASGTPLLDVTTSPSVEIGGQLQAAVVVGREVVDDDGVLVASVDAGRQVTVRVEGPVSLASPASGTTNGDGTFGVRISCDAPGTGRLIVGVSPRATPEVSADPGADQQPAEQSPTPVPAAVPADGALSHSVTLPACVTPPPVEQPAEDPETPPTSTPTTPNEGEEDEG